MAAVQRLLDHPDLLPPPADDHTAEIAALKREIVGLDQRYARWNSLFEQGGITGEELLLNRQRLYGQRDKLRAQIEGLLRQSQAAEARAAQIGAFAGLCLADLPDDHLRTVYHTLIKTITLRRGEPLQIIPW